MIWWRSVAIFLAGGMIALGAPKLAFERLALHQFEDGPLVPDNYELLPAETGWFGTRVIGFSQEKAENQSEDDDQHVKLSWQVRVMDGAGTLVEKPRTGVIDQILRRQDKDWIPKIVVSFLIPSFAPGGDYKVAVNVTDELAHTQIAGDLLFRVRGPAIPSANSLTIRNVRFFRNEDDSAPLRTALYKPGSAIWARFEIAGYKFEANNRFTVIYGISVLKPDGSELFSQPDAATESQESFYPQRMVPAGLNIMLDGEVPAGTYTLVITTHDKIGGQMVDQKETFRVESF